MAQAFAIIASTYGWTHREMLNLTYRQFVMYYKEAVKSAARTQMFAIQSASFPYMNEYARSSITSQLSKLVDEHPMTTSESWSLLRKMRGLYNAI